MKRVLIPACAASITVAAAVVYAVSNPAIFSSINTSPGTAAYSQFNAIFTGDWQQYGQVFTNIQAGLTSQVFLLILTLIPAVFLIHYIVIGAKRFNHDGPGIFFFSVLVRWIHWLAALFFSVLVLTGVMIIFACLFGGGSLIITTRSIHLISAALFTVPAVLMFLMWFKDMLPMPCDIAWLFIMGGYLSKKKKPVPAGKFNAGQKMWFWLATVGGGVMTYTGWYLYTFNAVTDQLRIMALIHNFLGAALVAFFLVHLYMSLFAIKGAKTSMINGYKPWEEVEILHSRYKIPS